MKIYGIIGRPLGHSFSKPYFERKFAELGLTDHRYYNFPLETIAGVAAIRDEYPDLAGFNVTIPYKKEIIPLLDGISDEARAIGAVNCVKVVDRKLYGYNTDAYGFGIGLEKLLGTELHGVQGAGGEFSGTRRTTGSVASGTHRANMDFSGTQDTKLSGTRDSSPKFSKIQQADGKLPSALVLGSGGAASAVCYVLDRLGIEFCNVSRSKKPDNLTYEELSPAIMRSHRLIVNTTPLGTWPDVDNKPGIPYEHIGPGHFLYDLVYNPPVTAFLAEGRKRGAATLNGETMLHAQAERNWEIWNDESKTVG